MQALLGHRLAAVDAQAVRAVVDPGDGVVDLEQRRALAVGQRVEELAGVRGDRLVGDVLSGFVASSLPRRCGSSRGRPKGSPSSLREGAGISPCPSCSSGRPWPLSKAFLVLLFSGPLSLSEGAAFWIRDDNRFRQEVERNPSLNAFFKGLFFLTLPQELARHAQPLRRERPVAAGSAQRLLDVGVRKLPQRPAVLDRGGEQRFRRAERPGRKVLRSDLRGFRGENGLLDDVQQLPDVAGPRMPRESRLGVLREPPRRPVVGVRRAAAGIRARAAGCLRVARRAAEGGPTRRRSGRRSRRGTRPARRGTRGRGARTRSAARGRGASSRPRDAGSSFPAERAGTWPGPRGTGTRLRPDRPCPSSATSRSPFFAETAPVNAPRSWPKSSLSKSSSERLAASTRTKGLPPRVETSWIARARRSLPVPLSPRIRIVDGRSAARSIASISRASARFRVRKCDSSDGDLFSAMGCRSRRRLLPSGPVEGPLESRLLSSGPVEAPRQSRELPSAASSLRPKTPVSSGASPQRRSRA